jgi:glycosyltransferase involved in cell wall biosynthesis
MLNIGIDGFRFSSSYQTGKEAFVRNFYPNLFNIDKENGYTVYTPIETGLHFSDNVKTIVLKNTPYYSIWNQLIMPLNIRSKNNDLMIYNESMVPFLNKTPCILVIYDLSFITIQKEFNQRTILLYKNSIKYSASAAKIIVAISESTKKDIIKYLNVNPEKVIVVPLALPVSFSNKLGTVYENEIEILNRFKVNSRYLIAIGSTHKYKNINRLIMAFNKLGTLAKYKDLSLIIVGNKTDDYVIENDAATNDSIIQTGYINDQELIVLLKNASVFCFPSLYEGFGLPLLEAMALGVPIAASNRSSIPEILGDAGLLFDPLSVDDITEKIQLLLSSEALRNQCIHKGYKQSNNYSWEKSAKLLLNKIDSIF